MELEFEWDNANRKHIIHDHPERDNTTDKVEEIFRDRYRDIKFNRADPKTGEKRFYALGKGTDGIIKYVVFVVRKGKIRPITCYEASKKLIAAYESNATWLKASGK